MVDADGKRRKHAAAVACLLVRKGASGPRVLDGLCSFFTNPHPPGSVAWWARKKAYHAALSVHNRVGGPGHRR
jgi:hypothetical protein